MSAIAPNHAQQWAGSLVPPRRGDAGNFDGGNDDTARLLRRYRLGLGLWVCSIMMLFVGFSSAYVVRRGIPTYDSASGAYSTAWEPLHLPLALLFMNLLVLVAASVTIEVGRRTARGCIAQVPKQKGHPARVWVLSSLGLLGGFIAGQAVAWQHLRANGEVLASGARAAFFYVLTGTHAAHALIGFFALAWLVLPGRASWSFARRYVAIDLTAWYLHSMAALWICLLGFLLVG